MMSVSKIVMYLLLLGIIVLVTPAVAECNFAIGCSMVPLFASIPMTWNGVTSTPSLLGVGLLLSFVIGFIFVRDPLGAWRRRPPHENLKRLSQMSIRVPWFILALIGTLISGGIIGGFAALTFHQPATADFVSIYGTPTISLIHGGVWVYEGGECTINTKLSVECKIGMMPNSNITVTVNLINNAAFTIDVSGSGYHNSAVIVPYFAGNSSIIYSSGPFISIHFPLTLSWRVPLNTAGETGADFKIILH